jgi:pyridoxal 5'-phosphate synthase pdxT subunit
LKIFTPLFISIFQSDNLNFYRSLTQNRMNIGVLALQGAFIEHIGILKKLGSAAEEIRLPEQLKDVDGLIIPGGESTTIIKLLKEYQLFHPLKEMGGNGFPIWGTCAGMICLAASVTNSQEVDMETLKLIDIEARRNAFGRQVDSFEVDLDIPALGNAPFHAVFIRAPYIDHAGPKVEVLSRLDNGTIVAARQNNILVTSFHPELTDDHRFHEYFLDIAAAASEIYSMR